MRIGAIMQVIHHTNETGEAEQPVLYAFKRWVHAHLARILEIMQFLFQKLYSTLTYIRSLLESYVVLDIEGICIFCCHIHA